MLEAHGRDLKKLAVLENAFDREETQTLNGVGEFSFSLPVDDPKTEKCQQFGFVRNDGGDFYRLLSDEETTEDYGVITYEAEHGIATLVDDLMFGTHIVGGAGIHTREVLEYILTRQTVRRWVLGECDFDKQFEYCWESENLLNALYSVPNLFTEPCQWVYDMRTYPWTVSLKRIDKGGKPQYYLRAGKNLIRTRKTRAGEQVCTRLYLRGYGEGDNQLTIREVNGGLPYLQSPQEYIDRYGLVCKEYVDRSFEDAVSLLERGKALLQTMQEPQYTREFDVADLQRVTMQPYDAAQVGRLVRLDKDNTTTYITKVSKRLDEPGDMKIELSTSPVNLAADIADIAERQRIEQVYAQGATQIYAQSLQTNATPSTQAVMNFFVPREMRIINKVVAKIGLEAFRTYSRETAGGGGDTTTSEAAGQGATTSRTGGGGAVTSGPSTKDTVSISSVWTGNPDFPSTDLATSLTSTHFGNTGGASGSTGSPSASRTGTASGAEIHSHTMPHTHDLNGHVHSATHQHDVMGHRHNHQHQHQLSHSHNIEHTHSVGVPSHTHTVDLPSHIHSVKIPEHRHDIEHGIFRTGSPRNAGIFINNVRKADIGNDREIDLSPYLLNEDGKMPRGTFIRLGVLPDDLAYVTIDLTIQGFIQSRGGGTY